MSDTGAKPVLGFAAPSGTGKTTLLRQLIPILRQGGVRVGVIKHAHHDFDIDKPGKDSYELRKAGAGQMLVASSRRWALVHENEHEREPQLSELLGRLDDSELDLILVEGFKHEPFPKIELHRAELNQPLLFLHDESIVALACDQPIPGSERLPILNLNAPTEIAEFIVERLLNPPDREN